MHREIFGSGSGLRGGGGGGCPRSVGIRMKSSSILMACIAFAVVATSMLTGLASGGKVYAQDGGAALATKSLQEENSRLIAAIERLNQRIDALESKLTRAAAAGQSNQSTPPPAGQNAGGPNVAVSANPNPGKIHGLSVDPDGVSYEGGTWLHHPQTGQVVFAENIFQRRQGGGGSLVIELIRKNGKPVPLPSVTYGDLSVAQPPGNGGGGGGGGGGGRGNGGGGGGGGRGPRALIEFPGDDGSGE